MSGDSSQFCVNIFCVMPSNCTEATCPKDLFSAFECCRENSFNVSWIKEDECQKLKPSKEDVFILGQFNGPVFEYLRCYKCTIIGPQCLLVSVHKGEPLPEVPSPVYTVAMKGLTVTCTGFNAQEKKEISDKVQFMGGFYTSAFHGNVTHLLVKSVAEFSQKYRVAVAREVHMMTAKWVDAVWSTSSQEACHATDPAFAKYACPAFHGLIICASQIPVKEREALKKIVESNGGQYSGQLEMGKTNILISPVAEGDKYVYARRWKIRCLKPDWIYESAKKGYAADPEEYVVVKSEQAPRCSTPEADHTSARFGNGSINSTIMNESQIHHVNETVNTTVATGGAIALAPPAASHGSDWSDTVDALDLGQVRKAGPFLDGCKIFVSGFQEAQSDKLRRILNNSGAARFVTISESLSHVIVGQKVEDHWKQLEQLTHKPHVVTAEWLVQSYRLKRAAPELPYLHSDFKSAVQSGKENNGKKAAVEATVPKDLAADQETQLVHQYLAADTSEATRTESGIFAGLKFHLLSHDPDDELSEQIVANGGKLVRKGADYTVVDYKSAITEPVGSSNLVSRLWIEDCVDQEQLVTIKYHHRPIRVANDRILSGCVIAQSGIEGRERTYLGLLCQAMGAISQETFARKTVESKNIHACTHLVCPKPEGRKYEAAGNWGVAAVDPRWLLVCARTGVRQVEANWPVGTNKSIDEFQEEPDTEAETEAETEADTEVEAEAEVPADESNVPDENDEPVHRQEQFDIKEGPPTVSQTRSSLFNIPTPKTPYGRLFNANPSPDTRKKWKHALDNRVRLTPQEVDELSNQTPDGGAIGGRRALEPDVHVESSSYFECLRKKLRYDDGTPFAPIQYPAAGGTNAEEESDRRAQQTASTQPTADRPFKDVIVYIHKKLEEQQAELIRAVENLGGEARFQHCKEVTHFIYQGKMAASKEIRSAKEWMQKFVAPQWILDSEDAQTKLDEAQYPSALNPKMALSISVSSQQVPGSSQKRRAQQATPRSVQRRKPSQSEVTPLANPDTTDVGQPDLNVGPEPVEEEEEEATCKELLQLNEVLSRSTEQTDQSTRKSSVPVRSLHHVYVPPTQQLDEQQSQVGSVTWDLHETQKPTVQPQLCVMFSSMEQAERERCAKIIENLGGIVSTTSFYDPQATHIVVARPVRNEKLVSSIAAGKWVLCPEWLDVSAKHGQFVDEQDYEWGNPAIPSLCLEHGTQEASVAAAAYRCRIARSQGRSHGPFYGFKAILHVRDKTGAFQRLLEAGGGQVVAATPPYSDPVDANICIMDIKLGPPVDFPALAHNGVYCVPPVFLNTVLTSPGKPNWFDSVVPEFQPYLGKMPASSLQAFNF